MSGAAGLAAAKRRRNPPEMNERVTPKLSGMTPDRNRTNRPSNPKCIQPKSYDNMIDKFFFRKKNRSFGRGGENGSSYNLN